MKKIICDECVPKRLMHKLSDSGYSIMRPPCSESDDNIIAYASHFDYPVVTYDTDFKNYDKSIILQYGIADKSCVKYIKKVCKMLK